MTFDQWIYKVCEHIHTKTNKEMTQIYASIDLTDAKLAYLDGVEPTDYKH